MKEGGRKQTRRVRIRKGREREREKGSDEFLDEATVVFCSKIPLFPLRKTSKSIKSTIYIFLGLCSFTSILIVFSVFIPDKSTSINIKISITLLKKL